MSDINHPNRPNHPNLAFFPEALIQLNRELVKHPKLIELLNNHPAPEWEIRLAQVCQYCGIAVNGTFDADGITAIAEECIKRLRMRERDTYVNIPGKGALKKLEVVDEEVIEAPDIIVPPKLVH